MDRFENSFSRESIGLKHIERTLVEHLAAGVLDPQRAQWGGVLIPKRDSLRFNVRLQNGHQCRLVFSDVDLLLDPVFEEISGRLAFSLGPLLAGDVGHFGGLGLDYRWRAGHFHGLTGDAYIKRGIYFIVAADSDVNVAQVETLEAGSTDEHGRVARLNVNETVVALAIRIGYLGTAGFFVAHSHISAGDGRSRGVSYKAR